MQHKHTKCNLRMHVRIKVKESRVFFYRHTELVNENGYELNGPLCSHYAIL